MNRYSYTHNYEKPPFNWAPYDFKHGDIFFVVNPGPTLKHKYARLFQSDTGSWFLQSYRESYNLSYEPPKPRDWFFEKVKPITKNIWLHKMREKIHVDLYSQWKLTEPKSNTMFHRLRLRLSS